MIFALGVIIRMATNFNGVYLIKEFDPWVQYRCTVYVVDNGLEAFLNWRDYMSWYPEGNPLHDMYPGLIVTNAIFYWILSGLGFPVTVYDVCFNSPAFMGGVACIATYLVGKEILDKKTGVLAAFFMALSPGFMQRTTNGFYDNETVGVFATLLVLFFFIRSIKKGSLVDGVLGGFSFGYLNLSWGGFTYIALLIPLFTILLIVFKKYTPKLLLSYSSVIGVGLIIHMFVRRTSVESFMHQSDLLIPLLVLVGLPFVEFVYRRKESDPAWYLGFWRVMKYALVIGIVAGGVLLTFFGSAFLVFTGRQLSILNPFLRETISLVASVGEHMPSPWAVFYYNTFIPLLFVVPGIYFAYKRGTETDIIFIIYILTLYYFTGSMTRIILLLAPAIALVGSYGISQILKSFGTIAQKRTPVARRRKRETRQLLDRPTAGLMFIFIGGLCIGQVFHATNIAATQMPYTEIVVGGQFHDWEEAITWMKTNLNSETVIVSWWDYGYWMTVNGNVTSVNDNATINSTRIGFTGMGMMMNDELESAKIFKALGADYVLVYFGHLISGLGGDEGKWPWMVKICNDYSKTYSNTTDYPMLDQSKWHVPGEQVFNYGEYINETSGLYKARWFNSSLVRMMFYDEPTTTDKATTQLQYWTAREISGDGSDNYQPRKDDSGKLWTAYLNDPSYSDFKVFRKAFFSSNTTVKIFKVDYSAIESDFTVQNITAYQNGIGHVNVTNTGSKVLNITGVGFNQVMSKVYPFEGTPEVQPNQTKSFWFDANPAPPSFLLIGVGDNHTLTVRATVQGSDKTFTIDRYKSTIIKNVTTGAISIDRLHSKGDAPNVVEVAVRNTGNITVDVNEIKVDTLNVFDKTKIIPIDGTTVIPVNQSRRFQVTITSKNYTVGDTVQVNVTTKEKAWDASKVTFCDGESNLAFVSDFITLPESDLIRDNKTFLSTYNLVNFTRPEMTTSRNFLPVDLSNSVAYTNGTIRLKVKNTGTATIGISEFRLNGSTYSGWILENSQSYFVEPGGTRTLRVSHSALHLDAFQDVQVLAIDMTGKNVAADRASIKTVVGGEAIKILTDNQFTFAYTNETVAITVKNVGTVATTINRISINGSADIPITPRTLAVQEACVISHSFSASSIANFTRTDKALLVAKSSTNKESTVIVNAKMNPLVSLNIQVDELTTSGRVSIKFLNNGTTGLHLAQNVSWVRFDFNETAYWVFPKEAAENVEVAVGSSRFLTETSYLYIQWPGPSLSVSDEVKVTIFSVQGGEASITVSATAG